MVIARLIGRPVTLVGGALVAVLGIVLIVWGAAASPTSTSRIVIGIGCVIVGALLFLDALSEKAANRTS
jgi:uncharacterized membrane protein HdeD (DUF308 family)